MTLKKLVNIIFLALIFFTFVGGLADKGPSRRKFKVLEGGSEDLIKPEPAPAVNRLKEISNNKHLVQWASWWQKCVPGFSLNSMEDLGEFPVDNEPTDFTASDKIKKGPGGMFYTGSPDGKRYINPYWGRLTYKWNDDGWWPYVENQCGAELYEPSQKKSAIILRCYMHDGMDGAFWAGKDRLVLMGYDAVTRQMNVECETVESCVSPSVWIVDLKSNTFNQHRGNVVKRDACNLDGYLKLTLPRFFGEK